MGKYALEETIGRSTGDYGTILVDFRAGAVLKDELDRKKIWQDGGEDYLAQQDLYASILSEIVESVTQGTTEAWVPSFTDFGAEGIIYTEHATDELTGNATPFYDYCVYVYVGADGSRAERQTVA
jgi:hypothetical protein